VSVARPFVHLHNHTTYSLLDGAQRLDEMTKRAADDGQPAVAITDHGNLFGALEFARKADAVGIKPIVGIEAYVAPGSRLDRQAAPGKKPYNHLVLLAQSYEGYKNLIQLSSAGFLEGFYYRPRIDRELLAKHNQGLLCLSACLAGEVASHLNAGRDAEAARTAGEFRELFGPDRYWLEIQDHGLPEQKRVNEGLVKIAREQKIPLVATNDCHYLTADDHFAHDVLVCIQTGKSVHSADRIQYSKQHYLKTAAEMAQLFDWVPEAVEATAEIASRCGFAFDKQPNHLPEFPVPEGYDLAGYFEKVTRDGFARRMPAWRAAEAAGRLRHPLDDYRARLEREIAIIRQVGFAGYFLVVWDFIRYAREAGIPVGPGRGSAAGSLVAYCLWITDIDPVEFDLLFERFLNPERVSLPDIDIDFCFRRRERVIEYVTGKYGRPNVAQIITFGTMAARAALRDVGRALEVPFAEVDRIAKLVPAQPGVEVTLDSAMQQVPALKAAYDNDQNVKQMIDLAKRLEGLVRHASTHAAGVVIAPRPLVDFAPLYRGSNEEVTTQFAKDDIESIGLLKMDFLGLKTLTLISDAVESIAATTGEKPDVDHLPFDDAKVYELFTRARTSGIFQFESSGMRDILRRLKPERFEDLVALNALYRPGPIGGGLIDDFVQRRHGKVKVEYPHPLLEGILSETYGVIVYQEQVMQIASTMAGYSLGAADNLRRAMGKKKKEVMQAERESFLAGANKNGVKKAEAVKVFELMEFFAGYGFNKSHSAAYALVAFQTAWLKAHYPVHFMAALLTTEKDATDKLVKYVNECKDMGIAVLPPDVNRSGLDFTVEGGAVRFGLSAIKNVGEQAIRNLLDARAASGPFTALGDLCARVDLRQVNKRVIEALIQSGALDSLGAKRSQLAKALDSAIESGQRRRADREAGQASLFGGGPAEEFKEILPDEPDWDERTRLGFEKATLGFYVSGHPLESHRELLRDFTTHTSATAKDAGKGSEVALAGIVTGLNRRRSKKGAWWATLQLEDLEGWIEVLVFPKAYEGAQNSLADDRAVLVTGRAELEDDRVRLLADTVMPLDGLVERKAEAIQLRVEAGELDDDVVLRLRAALERHRGDKQVFFEVLAAGRYRMVARAEPALRVQPSADLTREIDGVLGPGRIVYRARRR